MLTHVISKGDSIHIDKRNYVENKDEEVESPVKHYSQLENSKKAGKDESRHTQSAHNLNNAFIEDEEYKIPKKSNSLCNFSSNPGIKCFEDMPLKCPQPSKPYDHKKIKEYIRMQKQLRHKKMVEEKEKKKLEDERKRAKLLELRSKSKELVEVSVKRRSAILKHQIEDLQHNTLDVGDTVQTAPLTGITERSEVLSESFRSKNNGVTSSGPGEPKNLCYSHSDESVNLRAIAKPVSHVCLQTGDSLVELEPQNEIIEGALESDKLVSSLRLPSLIIDNGHPLTNPEQGVREGNVNEKSDASKIESRRVVLDKETCTSMQREVEKLAHNVNMLKKHKMIGVFTDKPIIHPSPMQRNDFEVAERQAPLLKNTNSSLWGMEQQMCAKNPIPTHVFQSNNLLSSESLNLANPLGSTQPAHHPLEKSTYVKSSAQQPSRPELSVANIENLILPSDKLVSEEKLTEAHIEQEVQYDSDFETSARSSTVPNQEEALDVVSDSSDLDTATEDILPTDGVPRPNVYPPKPVKVIEIKSDSISESSQSTASVQSNYSHSDYKLVVPHISLSRSLSSRTSRSLESSKSESTRSLPSGAKSLKMSEDSRKEEISSIHEVMASSIKDQGSSVKSSETKISITSKPERVDENLLLAASSSESVRKSSGTAIRSALAGESVSKSKDAISNSSSGADLRIFSGSHANSIQELRMINNHAEKLAEMERKAFEHRMEMERAFEKERLKLELALAEAKRTVFDSKLEASKFISDAAVELIKSQAEATKANAEATKHLSEAKVIDSLKLEAISAQSASAAAFAAVQAAMKQFVKVWLWFWQMAVMIKIQENVSIFDTVLKSFAKVKHTPRKSENSISSERSETSSLLSEANEQVSLSKESDSASNVEEKMAQKMSEVDKRSESSVAEELNVEENVDDSVEKAGDAGGEELNDYPVDSSIPSISENISEQEYSSKFDDTASEIEVKAKPEEGYGIISIIVCFDPYYLVPMKRKQDALTDKHNLGSVSEMQGFLEYPDINEDSSISGKDSFTKFSLSMFQQLMREEEMRAQHQQALLKLREETLIDKIKAEMTLLELKKKHSRDKGHEDVVSSIRKKQRGMLIRLRLEKDEIQRSVCYLG
ncbi:centrosome-associated protein 350-like [Hetaerina americana]|uniref:centrosome-associated protein 350-like n=1 Tax=Hetaerina americana TaxID=62018 RepID=UPI003A7F548F